jgi:hypothetical protein
MCSETSGATLAARVIIIIVAVAVTVVSVKLLGVS